MLFLDGRYARRLLSRVPPIFFILRVNRYAGQQNYVIVVAGNFPHFFSLPCAVTRSARDQSLLFDLGFLRTKRTVNLYFDGLQRRDNPRGFFAAHEFVRVFVIDQFFASTEGRWRLGLTGSN